MYHELAPGFFWKGLRRDIETFVNFCPECAVKRTIRTKEAIDINPLRVPPGPFHTITMDFITDLPEDTDWLSDYQYDALLTITCRFSKAKILIPGRKDWKAADWATAFYDCVIPYWGLPKVTISDRNKHFLGGFWQEVYAKAGVRHLVMTAYHPSADGQLERTNVTIKITL